MPYIYNGQEVSLERIQAASSNLNLSVEDYIKKYNIEQTDPPVKKQGPAKETAIVGSKNQAVQDTGLSSEDFSSDLLGKLNTRVYNEDTDSYEMKPNGKLFSMMDNEAADGLNELYKFSGIKFEAVNSYYVNGKNQLKIDSEKGLDRDSNDKYNPMRGGNVVKASIGGKEMIFETNTDDPEDWKRATTKIENFIKENESSIDYKTWRKQSKGTRETYLNWESSNENIQKAEDKYKADILDNEDLFTPYKVKQQANVGYVSSTTGIVVNTSPLVEKTVQPHEEELNSAIKRLRKIHPEASKEDIDKKAKQIVRKMLYTQALDEAKYAERERAVNDGDIGQEEMFSGAQFIEGDLADKYNLNSKKTNILSQEIENILEVHKAVQNTGKETTIEEAEKNDSLIYNYAAKNNIFIDPSDQRVVELSDGTSMNRNEYLIRNSLRENYLASDLLFNKYQKEQQEVIGDIKDIKASSLAASKNYNELEKYATNVGMGAVDIGAGMFFLGGNILTLGQSDGLAELGADYSMYSRRIRDSYVRDVSFEDAFSSGSNFGKFLGQEVSNQLPILVAMMASGGSAGVVIGASSAGSKMIDMQAEVAMGNADYGKGEIWLKSIGYGVAEGGFAQLTTVQSLRRAKKNWILDGKEQVVNNSMKEYFKKRGSSLIYEPLSESLGEIATVGTQNLIDGNNFTQGMDHAGFSGAGFGLLFAAVPFMKGTYNASRSTYGERKQARDLMVQINKDGKELDGLLSDYTVFDKSNRRIPAKNNSAQDNSQRAKFLEKRIKDNTDKLNKAVEARENLLNEHMTEDGAKNVIAIEKEMADLQAQALEIENNPTLSKAEKAKEIQELQAKFKYLVEVKESAINARTMKNNGVEFTALKGSDPEKYDEYQDQAASQLFAESNGKDPSKEATNRRAYDLYFADKARAENSKQGRKNSSVFKDFKSFETVDEAIADLDNQDLSPDQKKTITDGLKRGNDGYANPVTKQTVAVVENQVKNQRAYTKTHEVGHQAFWELLGQDGNSDAFKNISNQLLHTLKNVDSKVYNDLLKDIGNEINDPTEVISKFLEFVAANEVDFKQDKKAKGIAGLLGIMVQKQFEGDYKFDFRGETDMYNFVVGIGKKIADGTLTLADVKAAKKNSAISSIKDSSVSTDSQGDVSFSLTTRQDLNWKQTDEDVQTTFEVKGKKYTTRLEETAFMEFDEGQTYDDIDNIAKKLGIQKDSEGDDISSSEKFYHLQFADNAGSMDITGAGNALEVFSVNINGVVDYLQNNPKVEGVVFTAKEDSRIRLYKRLAETMADKLGGSFGFENDTFIVTNKKSDTKSDISFSETSLGEKINNLIPSDVKNQIDYYRQDVFDPIYNDRKLHPLIQKYVSSKASSPQERAKVIRILADRLKNFNPAKTRSSGEKVGSGALFEFITSNAAFSKKVAKQEFVDAKNNPTSESIDSDQAKQVSGDANEVTSTNAPKKPTYIKIIDSRVLPGETINKIKDKVISTVRVLKSRIDASVSKNQAISPLLRELKREISSQVDIDLKEAMGGVADSKLQKWLIKNKKAVLENATTSWLAKAIPAAIQKSVDGKYKVDENGNRVKDNNGNFTFVPNFTSDWQGKKIDVEKTTTNNAGKTSGAQIMRRTPNAARKISDADFVATVLENVKADADGNVISSGKPIRGKKESMAKELAGEIGIEIINRELKNKDSNLTKAFKENQSRLNAVLTVDFLQEFSRQSERGTIKFSESTFMEGLPSLEKSILDANVEKLTEASLRKIMTNVYGDKISQDELKQISKKIVASVNTYFKNKKDLYALDFTKFVNNAIDKLNNKEDLLTPLNLTKDDIFGGFTKMGDQESVQRQSRQNELEFNTDLVNKKGYEGLQQILRWMKGHNVTSSKIGGGRGQYYNGVTDYYINNLNLIPDVKVEVIKRKGKKDTYKIYYTGKVSDADIKKLAEKNNTTVDKLKDSNGLLVVNTKTLPQSAYKIVKGEKTVKTEAEFEAEYDQRKAESDEAFDLMIDFLQFTRNKNNPLLWVATMKSLDSNMESMLKAAANVAYYFVGDTNQEVRFEHLIPTNYMIMRLTEHFWSGKVDLDALKNSYEVAIVPKDMDELINIQSQSTMNIGFDPSTDPAWHRYYNDSTYGMDFIVPIKKLGGDSKGKVFGEEWAAFNSILKDNASSQAIQVAKEQKAALAASSIKWSQSSKKIRVFDFDDTLAKSKSRVIVNMPVSSIDKDMLDIVARRKFKDEFKNKPSFQQNFESLTDQQQAEVLKEVPGGVKTINATEFAEQAASLEAQGATFDFSEFSKVIDGEKGPLFKVAKKIADKRGTEDLFILTARPQDAAGPIKDFMKSLGIDIPLKNITGLADGNAKAKADWMVGKVSEGYNDFYFADDAIKNVNAVKEVLDNFDVKGKVQQAKIKFSETLHRQFNDMIERQTGVESIKVFSKVVARRRGKKAGGIKFLAPGAEDFRGLTQYVFAGKGKQGDADQKFFEDALMDPYFKGVAAMETARQTLKNDFKALLKTFKPVKAKLNKLIPGGDFTYDAAVRVYLWTKAGYDIPGIAKRDQKKLNSLVSKDTELKAFADGLILVTKSNVNGWPAPTEFWDAHTIVTDISNLTEKINRKEYLNEFIENVDQIFSDKNLNKVEALYGKTTRDAIEDALYSMKTGTNRPTGGNSITNRWLNWVNNSVGTIMFFNRRSALLQTLSTVNFINWSDNNPLKAAMAFANQKQYWKDFTMIFNSDKLKQRRSGLKSDVQEAEIANAAKNSKDKASAIVSYLLKIGFTPTQLADSFAIAMGGATFYRNRVKTYTKQGMSKSEAETKAFEDFSKLSDVAQQSGDPALVSQQQRSVAGRLILAFQNTTMQYTRIQVKAARDLINGRGDAKTHISKILYYGAVQNFIFNALQQSLFALIPGFEEDDKEFDEELDKKGIKIINGMADSTLRGFGMYGAVIAAIKNTYLQYSRQEEKGYKADHTYTIIEAANLSPPIGSKLRKIYSGIQTSKFDKDVIAKHPWDVTIEGRFNPSPTYSIIGSVASAGLNIPLDRAVLEAQSIAEMFDERNTKLQRISLGLGYRTWDVGAKNEEFDLIKLEAKKVRKEQGKIKAKKTREINKKKKQDSINNLSEEQRNKYYRDLRLKRSASARKAAATRKKNKRAKDSIMSLNRI
jgi:hypothetical protein